MEQGEQEESCGAQIRLLLAICTTTTSPPCICICICIFVFLCICIFVYCIFMKRLLLTICTTTPPRLLPDLQRQLNASWRRNVNCILLWCRLFLNRTIGSQPPPPHLEDPLQIWRWIPGDLPQLFKIHSPSITVLKIPKDLLIALGAQTCPRADPLVV